MFDMPVWTVLGRVDCLFSSRLKSHAVIFRYSCPVSHLQNSSSQFSKTFLDPLVITPSDPISSYIVDSVNVTVYGRFNCDNSTFASIISIIIISFFVCLFFLIFFSVSDGATLIVRLDENVVQVLETDPAPTGCDTCPTCSVGISVYGSAAWLGINGMNVACVCSCLRKKK